MDTVSMTPQLIYFAVLFTGLGSFFLGIFAGKTHVMARDRRSGRIRSTSPSQLWFYAGAILTAIGMVAVAIGSHPVSQTLGGTQ